MRRPKAPAAVTAALLAAVLSFVGCSGGSNDGATATDAPAEGAGGATSLPRTLSGAVDLRQLVVSNAPVGFEALAAPPFGAVDLERLLEQFSDAVEADRAILEGARFKGGYTRGWLRESPRAFLGVFVFDFAHEEGARSALDQFAAQLVAKRNATRFAVEAIAGAIGESYSEQAEGAPPERVHVVTFVRGTRLYQVAGQFADQQAPPDELVAFAKVQDQIAA